MVYPCSLSFEKADWSTAKAVQAVGGFRTCMLHTFTQISEMSGKYAYKHERLKVLLLASDRPDALIFERYNSVAFRPGSVFLYVVGFSTETTPAQ